MYGRYGQDGLNMALSVAALLVYGLSAVLRIWPLYGAALLLMAVALFRALSRNVERRRREAAVYARLRGRVRPFFANLSQRVRQRRTHRFYRCPSCGKQLRVPRGKGKISIKCPCGTAFVRKT
jgi:type II secretory pathway component PulF